MNTLISAAVALLLLSCPWSPAQEPSTPAPPPASSSPQSSGEPSTGSLGSSSSRPKSRVASTFLIIGTVFNEHAMSFPGVQVRIRRSGEKKFRWETYTDSRGEFAVRVPPGQDYDIVIHVKKYEDQSETVNAKADVQQRLSIKMEPQGEGKTGGKP